MNTFQLNVFKAISESSSKENNIIISPISIYHILSLTTNGASGNTKTEMLTTLCNENQEKMNENNKLIYSIINNFKNVEFANSIFTRDIPIPPFLEKAKDYKAKIDKLKDEKQINDWCSDATHGLIQKIIDKILPSDIMVLINAIYFKGKWETKFEKRFTEKKEFFNYQKKKKLIDFMYSKHEYSYFENKTIQAISLNYQDDNLEALIILPKNDCDINKYIKNFNQEEYNHITNNLSNQKIALHLPKFEMKFEAELNKVLEQLGMQLAFKENADFSSMIKLENGEKNIFISKIIHSSYIKIDEEGTKAAASTEVVMFRGGRSSRPEKNIVMDINHPFLFIIRNKDLPSGHDILFISKVENLEEEGGKKTDLSKLETVNISLNRPAKWYMYVIKQVLKNRENVDVRAGPLGAAQAIRCVEALKRLGYITYSKYYTTSDITDGRIKKYIVIKVKKTKDFQKLFDEREAERNKMMENQAKFK